MPITNTAAVAGESAALEARKPFALTTNILRSSLLLDFPVWSTSGDPSNIGAYVTDDLYPTRYIYNGNLYDFTQPISGGDPLYIHLVLRPNSEPVDAVMIKMTNAEAFPNGINIQVRFSQNAGFSDYSGLPSNGIVAAGVTPLSNAKLIFPRLVGAAGVGTWATYTGVEYARIEFDLTSGVFGSGGLPLPQVSEIVIGKRRQFAHNPMRPYDPTPRASGVEDFVPPTRAIGRNIQFEGLATLRMRYRATSGNLYGIDEDAMFRAFYRDTRFGLRPFLWCDKPFNPNFSGYSTGYWVLMPNPELAMPHTGPAATDLDLELWELPPAQAVDEGVTA